MVAGFNMLSFDLFGIGRRMPVVNERVETEFQDKTRADPMTSRTTMTAIRNMNCSSGRFTR